MFCLEWELCVHGWGVCKHSMIVVSLFTLSHLSYLSLSAGLTVTFSLLMWPIVLVLAVQSLITSEVALLSVFRRQVQRTALAPLPLATVPRHPPYHSDSKEQHDIHTYSCQCRAQVDQTLPLCKILSYSMWSLSVHSANMFCSLSLSLSFH